MDPDPSVRPKGRRLWRWIVPIGLLVFAAAGLVAFLLRDSLFAPPAPPEPAAVQAPVETTPAQPDHAAVKPSNIIDLPGDPVTVRRSESEAPRSVPITLPALLSGSGPQLQGKADLISTSLIPPYGGFMGRYTDAAQRTEDEAAALLENQQPEGVADSEVVDTGMLEGFDDDGGAEAFQSNFALAPPPPNSNLLEVTIGGGLSDPTLREVEIRPVVEESISQSLVRSGFSPETAAAVEEASKTAFNIHALLPGSFALATGALDLTGAYRVTQFSIYENNEYVGTIALSEAGGYGEGAEPFVPPAVFDATPKAAGAPTEYTVADGIYSAGIRSNMPEPILREALTLIGRLTDLKQPLETGQAVRLLYSRQPRDKDRGTGKVIYVGLTLPAGPVDCYVFKAPDGSFRCIDQAGTATGGGGIVSPVAKGIRISSVFGMRMHPILHILRLHAGVDWATPIGTPVMAIADGVVEIAGPARGFGNHVRVKHKGFETSYSHLEQFADQLAVGSTVTRGQVVGFSGNSGLSTGPHLHFQYYIGGVPVDPLLHLDAQTAALDTNESVNFVKEKKVIDEALAAAGGAVEPPAIAAPAADPATPAPAP